MWTGTSELRNRDIWNFVWTKNIIAWISPIKSDYAFYIYVYFFVFSNLIFSSVLFRSVHIFDFVSLFPFLISSDCNANEWASVHHPLLLSLLTGKRCVSEKLWVEQVRIYFWIAFKWVIIHIILTNIITLTIIIIPATVT